MQELGSVVYRYLVCLQCINFKLNLNIVDIYCTFNMSMFLLFWILLV